MPKLKFLCPFSKMACRDCGIFRGRHFEMCYNPRLEKRVTNREEFIARGIVIQKPKREEGPVKFDFHEFLEPDPSWITDPEDHPERRDL